MIICFTAKQLALYLKAKPSEIRNLATLGILPTLPGRVPYLFALSDVEEWKANGGYEKHIKEYDHSDFIIGEDKREARWQ